MTSQECIQRKTDTKQETALGFILACGESESVSSWIVDALLLHKLLLPFDNPATLTFTFSTH